MAYDNREMLEPTKAVMAAVPQEARVCDTVKVHWNTSARDASGFIRIKNANGSSTVGIVTLNIGLHLRHQSGFGQSENDGKQLDKAAVELVYKVV